MRRTLGSLWGEGASMKRGRHRPRLRPSWTKTHRQFRLNSAWVFKKSNSFTVCMLLWIYYLSQSAAVTGSEGDLKQAAALHNNYKPGSEYHHWTCSWTSVIPDRTSLLSPLVVLCCVVCCHVKLCRAVSYWVALNQILCLIILRCFKLCDIESNFVSFWCWWVLNGSCSILLGHFLLCCPTSWHFFKPIRLNITSDLSSLRWSTGFKTFYVGYFIKMKSFLGKSSRVEQQ